ncbi:anti-sigma-I factor RsgI7 [Clostridiales bacterium]|nr:anti-sigma-I factor RsgI7 [Clostridiales bacterium]
MNDRLKRTFSQIQAEEELKKSTREFLVKKTQGYAKTIKNQYRSYVAACASLLFILIGGHWLYFTPIVEISLDINPSIELSLNRLERLISVNGLNDDGLELTNTLDIKFKKYTDAINQILGSENIANLMSNNEIMTITVTGPEGTKSEKVLLEIEACTVKHNNTYCYFAHSEDVAAAHELGLSYGKYRALLEIQTLDPDISHEEIHDMTMREIHDLIDDLSKDNEREQLTDGYGDRYHGFGGGHGGHGNEKHGHC